MNMTKQAYERESAEIVDNLESSTVKKKKTPKESPILKQNTD